MATTLSNIYLSNNEYFVSNSNPSGLLTINQPTTQNYVFGYSVNIPASRIHNFISTIGDLTSNVSVALNGSNLQVYTATSNLFSNTIPSAYLTAGYNTILTNRIDDKLIVNINGSTLSRNVYT